jgi:predicted nuclease with TOPRIM domain
MSKAEFLTRLEGISEEFVTPTEASELYDAAEEIFQELEDENKELTSEKETLKGEVKDLEVEIEGYEEQVSELQDMQMYGIEGSPFDNLRGKMVFDKLFENLKYIPVDELESLVQKHAVI